MNVLIFGASGGLGLGFVKKLLVDKKIDKIFATYYSSSSELDLLAGEYPDKLTCFCLDVTDEQQVADYLCQLDKDTVKLHLVVNCIGILHQDKIQPEKSLSQVNTDNLVSYFKVNSVASVIIAKYLIPLFRHDDISIFAVISAKVGSISDNQLGGWYGYRASKAALNMLLKTIAIEYQRKSPQTVVTALHPGTIDTKLSIPFQKNVDPDRLFSVEKGVNHLYEILQRLEKKDSGKFFSWDGSEIGW
jgi:short-subunit dehydrogenase